MLLIMHHNTDAVPDVKVGKSEFLLCKQIVQTRPLCHLKHFSLSYTFLFVCLNVKTHNRTPLNTEVFIILHFTIF